MKAISWRLPSIGPLLLVSLLSFPTHEAFAQNFGSDGSTTAVPTVTIRATDPIATWAGKPGVFTVFRSGDPAPALNVYYEILGTASNGVDYAMIGNFVQLSSGVVSNTVVINPTGKSAAATKTVILELAPSPLLTPVNYMIGNPSNATVFITAGSISNIPPEVTITSPTNGAVYYTPVDLPLIALARDQDGSVSTVEFFDGLHSLGVVSNGVIVDPIGPGNPPPGTRAYFLTWSNVPPAIHVLTAVATDNAGASNTSMPVVISVKPGPPPTNLPPVVRITSPANHATFRGQVNIPLSAYAHDVDSAVSSVEFFAAGSTLGFGEGINASSTSVINGPTNVFVLVWTNPPPGTNIALTAKATDNEGASTLSEPVFINILPPLPPPTNRPPIVTIVATDPIAIEGTNCWPWLGVTNVTATWSNWPPPVAVRHYYTNCGPKNAIFAVRRFGTTNDALPVAYDIGGSASNGVDYVTLPGVVTIPAGDHEALISLVPIDDGPPDINSTVILTLKASASAPPDYLPGYPRRAAALILDGVGPRAVTGELADRCFHLRAGGPDGAWFSVEYSTDLQSWISICTNQVVQGGIDFVDPDAVAGPNRFYRTRPQEGPSQ